ncbi:hypothetical protein K469DRAFT_707284 [Zopfia rhizophila CBS 207.26]|uniref:Uncharacterized protein n=1 Tax=Zopfia rhizophila CBS 207.26 TaxID=1314779 RepID=A0A6A6E6J6_9PEZI|nr:hypothetical protein K469DRAFT_707284 [Zopfia rhizophila CBS 207.26]
MIQHCLRALRGRRCLIYKEELTSTVEAASQAGFISTDGQFGTGRSSRSTGSAGAYLEKNSRGHGFNKEDKINFSLPQKQPSDVANEIAGSFSHNRFLNAVQDWVISNNQALRVIETSTFQAIITAANPLIEKAL